jgi:UDP-GlcNAc:undecaprenyl-phosphate GlcNAc-1-phosphate transferase
VLPASFTIVITNLDRGLIAFFTALLISYFLTPFIKKCAIQYGALDQPNHRKVQKSPIPLLGGLAIFFGFLVAVLITIPPSPKLTGILLGATLIIMVGIIDDLVDLAPRIKMTFQVFATLILIYHGLKIEVLSWHDGMINWGILSVPVTMLWVVGLTNTMNIIDGLDGLSAGIALIACITLQIVAILDGQVLEVPMLTAAMAGGIIGFLRYNFNPASIFMGDTGSMFLGFMLASISILGSLKGATLVTLIIPIIALGIPIFDTALAIYRRRKTSIFVPDKEHFHHQFLALGLTHKQTVLVMYIISLCLGIWAILLTRVEDFTALGVLGFISLLFIMGIRRIKSYRESTETDTDKAEKNQADNADSGPDENKAS